MSAQRDRVPYLVVVVVTAIVAIVFALVVSAIDRPTSVAGSTTSTTWSEPETYCVGDLEHRLFIGPTNGIAAPSIAVVAWDPTCR